jgi:hypothetical protein
VRRALLFAAISLRAATSPETCAPCHKSETAAFAHAAMTRALERPNSDTYLTAKIGSYTYNISGGAYTVTDGRDTAHFPIDWVFGQGTVGRTYLFQREGRWYESRVSYFTDLKALDVTIGQQSITPHTLLEASGRLTTPGEAKQCFSCHSTTTEVAGVQCERCHGPTGAHIRSQAPMRRLSALTTEEMSDFCGECHRTWAQIAANGPRGIQNIRFQPYRLATSKCYDVADKRISCTACHDPHRDVATTASAYDAKCQSCHATRRCRVAARDCTTCHMPKLELPGSHHKFTDHKIRIVRANAPYPD